MLFLYKYIFLYLYIQLLVTFSSQFIARNAGAVIHTHSKNAVMATLLFPGKEFVLSHLEMIKVYFYFI